jgi:cell division protein FtsQ
MTTMARTRLSAPPPPLPGDVRLMNAVAGSVFVLTAVALLFAGVLWLMRAPAFAIRAIQLDGELARNSVPTIRANATPRLAGNFFSVDLQQAQAAFESVPWVRRAVVRRVWPDRLVVRLEEHRAAALWQGAEGDGGDAGAIDRLVNSHGEVFEANLGDVEDDDLPALSGPDGSAPQMLALLRRVQPALKPLGLEVERLHLSGRGSWRLDLDSGARIELGRGSEDEVMARTERFARTLTQVTGLWNKPLEYADLRHADGYALRLRGVTTTAGTSPPGPGAAKTN